MRVADDCGGEQHRDTIIRMNTNQTTQSESAPKSGNDVQDNKIMAALSYIWILSIIFLLVKKDSPFVQFHAKQAVVIFAASFIFGFIPVLGWLANVVLFVFSIMGIINAYQGKSAKLPIVSTTAEQ